MELQTDTLDSELRKLDVELEVIEAKPRRPFRDLILLVDIIGAAAAVTAVLSFFGPVNGLLTGGPLGLAQNLSVELLGTWISIRVLEYVVRRREEHEAGRTRLLRQCRFWLNQMGRARAIATPQEAQHLRRELGYLTYMETRFAKLLHASEHVLLRHIIGVVTNCVDRVDEIAEARGRAHGASRRIAALGRLVAAECAAGNAEAGPTYFAWLEADELVRGELARIDSLILSIAGSQAERTAAEARVMALTSLNQRFPAKDCATFFEAAEAAAEAKHALDSEVRHLVDLVNQLEVDIREETPERWV